MRVVMSDRHAPSFLSKSEDEQNEWPVRSQTPHPVQMATPTIGDPVDKLKNNPVVIGILLGIVIGIILSNMRPVIINPK